MKPGTKAALITTGLLLVAVATYAITRKKKVVLKPVKKPVTVIADSPIISTDSDTGDSIDAGSNDPQHVMQLQDALNELHSAVLYIRQNCNISWPLFSAWNSTGGNILSVNGVYDDKTAKVAQFYLNRTEVNLDYLDMIRNKLMLYMNGDRCKYPLSY